MSGIALSVVTGGFLLFFARKVPYPKSCKWCGVWSCSTYRSFYIPYSFKILQRELLEIIFFLYFIVGEFPFSLKILLFSFILNYWIAIPMQPLNLVEFALFKT